MHMFCNTRVYYTICIWIIELYVYGTISNNSKVHWHSTRKIACTDPANCIGLK